MTTLSERIRHLSAGQLEELESRLGTAAEAVSSTPIAIVGMGCRLPGGVGTPDEFWRLLAAGREVVGDMPVSRWEALGLEDQNLDAQTLAVLRSGGYLTDVAGFDAGFFGISPREANFIDPHHRILLEVAWEALQDAGMPVDDLRGTRTGVFAGLAMSDYLHIATANIDTIDAYAATGGLHSAGVGRLSYLLDLSGPAVAIDSACSSSLVALHDACQSLRERHTDVALAGGVNLLLDPGLGISLARFGMFSSDGHCKAFDAAADGYVRAEGCGVVVLKRLQDAIRDADRIHAVIRASVVNQDGRSNGLTAPSSAAQRALLTEAVAQAGIDPATVGMVEAHGTGTALGDPIEVEALRDVYGKGIGRCALGAVKTNLGHTEVAAGMTGLIKAVLALRHGKVPGNVNFRELNPAIDLTGTRLFVPTELGDWPTSGVPRLAGVSSFGVGGTNAHAIVEEAPTAGTATADAGLCPVLLSGATATARADNAQRLAEWLEGPGATVPLADLGYTLARRRSHHTERLALVASGHDDLVSGLRSFAAGIAVPGTEFGQTAAHDDRGPVWVFGGHGSQWDGMGRELLETEPAFRAVIEELEPAFEEHGGFSLVGYVKAGKFSDADIARVQPAIFAMQVGIAAVLNAYGMRPAAVVGHSMGEVAAAVVSGALDLAAGAQVICRRSALIHERLNGTGAMALIDLPVGEVEDRIAGRDGVWVAVHSSPRAPVVSGTPDAVDTLLAECEAEGLFARRIKGATFAAHSPHLDPLLDDMTAGVADLMPCAPAVTTYSTALPDPRAKDLFSPVYWAANLRNPVRFEEAVIAAYRDGHRTFVELSPHPVVIRSISDVLSGEGAADVCLSGSLIRDQPERFSVLTAVGRLHCRGVPIDWESVYPTGEVVTTPPYAWQRERHWAPEAPRHSAVSRGEHHLLGRHVRIPGSPPRHAWQAELGLDRIRPWLSEHGTGDAATLPAAGYAEMALAAGCAAFDVAPVHVQIEELRFLQFLPLDEPIVVTTTLEHVGEDEATVEIASEHAAGASIHATARIAIDREPLPPPAEDLEAVLSEYGDRFTQDDFYERLRLAGAMHGPTFTSVTGYALSGDSATSALAWIDLPAGTRSGGQMRAHPVLLDGCLQALSVVPALSSLLAEAHGPGGGSLILVGIDGMRCYRPLGDGTVCRASIRVERTGDGEADLSRVDGRVALFDATGRPVLELTGVRFTFLRGEARADRLGLPLYEVEWQQAPSLPAPAAPEAAAGRWIVTAPAPGAAQSLADDLARLGARCGPPSSGLTSALPTPDDGGRLNVVITAGDALGFAADVVRSTPVNSRLWLVTAGAVAVRPGEATDPERAALAGLARGLAAAGRTVTLLDAGADGDAAAALLAESASDRAEHAVAYRHGERYVARLTAFSPRVLRLTVPVVRPVRFGTDGFGLELPSGRRTGSAQLLVRPRRAPGAGQVEIRVAAAGLAPGPGQSAAVGQADPVWAGRTCAGVVTAVGPGTDSTAVGDTVAAVADGCAGSFALVDAATVVPCPPSLPAEAGVAAMLDFLTGQGEPRLELLRPALAGLLAAYADGRLPDPPRRTHPLDDMPGLDAIAAETLADDLVVATVPESGTALASLGALPERLVRADTAYLICGTEAGPMLPVVASLAARGARRIVLCLPPGAKAPAIAVPESVEVLAECFDLSDRVSLDRVLKRAGWPAGGIWQVAHQPGGAPGDARAAMERARCLHDAATDMPLDWLITTCPGVRLGDSGDTALDGALAGFLAALSRAARSRGVRAVTFGWDGEATEQGNDGKPAADPLAVAEALLASARASADLVRFAGTEDELPGGPFWAVLGPAAYAADADNGIGAQLGHAASGPDRRHLLEHYLAEQFGAVLRMDPAAIEPTMAIGGLGIDSLTALELRGLLEADLEIKLPATAIWSYPTVTALAASLAERLGIAIEPDGPH